MPEIRNTTDDEAVKIAIAKIHETADMIKGRLDHEVAEAIAEIQLRATAIPELNSIAGRAKHAWVKDHHVPRDRDYAVPLGGTALRLTTGQELKMIEPLPWGADVPKDQTPSLWPGKSYRFWLFVEEIPSENGTSETKEGRGR